MDGCFLALVTVGSDIRFPLFIVDSRQHGPAGPRFWVDGLLRLEERQPHTTMSKLSQALHSLALMSCLELNALYERTPLCLFEQHGLNGFTNNDLMCVQVFDVIPLCYHL